jgi:Tol biopolymer transport system component
MRKRSLGLLFVAFFSCSSWGQNPAGYLVDWAPQKETSQGLVAWLHARLDPLVRTLVHYTSPDIPRESRRLWKISVDGTNRCVLASDTGVHLPRWGNAGYILFFVEADTNGDGRIDSQDDYLIRVVPATGGASRTIAQGKSAVWSPDGRFVAYVRSGHMGVVNLDGAPVGGNQVPAGQIIMSNSPNPEVARNFWAVDSQTANQVPLPSELSGKYLWMGMLSPSGTKIVYSNTTKTALVIAPANQTSGTNLIADDALNLDPSWSPDEKQVVYVSTSKPGTGCSAR